MPLADAAAAAADRKATDLVVLDVSEHLAITDHFLLCSGGNERHVDTISDAIRTALGGQDRSPIRSEGGAASGWILIDYGDFVVHVFSTQMREYYDLERLWKDVPRAAGDALAPSLG